VAAGHDQLPIGCQTMNRILYLPLLVALVLGEEEETDEDTAESSPGWQARPYAGWAYPRPGRYPRTADGGQSLVDFSGATVDAETGKLCIIKEDYLDTTRRDPVLKCDHKQIRQCHYTYVTKFEPTSEEVCEESFEKICQIVFRQQAVNETVRKCYTPMELVCDEQQRYPKPLYELNNSVDLRTRQKDADVVCRKLFETVCSTRYVEKRPGQFVGDTSCRKVPTEICGRPDCEAAPGAKQCADIVVAAVSEVPEETCDLSPRRLCRPETRLVPKLSPVEECRLRPRQVCSMQFGPQREERKPLRVKLCLKEGGVEARPSYAAPKDGYGVPAASAVGHGQAGNLPIVAPPRVSSLPEAKPTKFYYKP